MRCCRPPEKDVKRESVDRLMIWAKTLVKARVSLDRQGLIWDSAGYDQIWILTVCNQVFWELRESTCTLAGARLRVCLLTLRKDAVTKTIQFKMLVMVLCEADRIKSFVLPVIEVIKLLVGTKLRSLVQDFVKVPIYVKQVQPQCQSPQTSHASKRRYLTLDRFRESMKLPQFQQLLNSEKA